jgi:hypothetical protein
MTSLSSNELDEIYQFAIQLGKDAGQILLDGLEKRRTCSGSHVVEAQEKANAVDIVTQTDNGRLKTNGIPSASRLCLRDENQMSRHSSTPPSKPAIRRTPLSAKKPIPKALHENT